MRTVARLQKSPQEPGSATPRRVDAAQQRPAPSTSRFAHDFSRIPISRSAGGVVQRAPSERREYQYKKLVEDGTWCRDSEASGKLHPGLQCYREVPAPEEYPAAEQHCFSKTTGEYVEPSRDFVSAVMGRNSDGTCDLAMTLTDPPNPFTQRGRRALGHVGADIATEDPDLIGRHFGRISGLAMGIAFPKHGLDYGLATVAIPAILGFIGGELAARGLPLLNDVAKRRGFLPTIQLGAGSGAGVSLGVGLEKRDHPLPIIPINTYPTFAFDSNLELTREPGAQFEFLTKVGVRIDPGKQGGLFALGSVGAGVGFANDVSGLTSVDVGIGYRGTDFLDVQFVRESVSGGEGDDTTWWLTLKVVAPQSVLKGHPKEE